MISFGKVYVLTVSCHLVCWRDLIIVSNGSLQLFILINLRMWLLWIKLWYHYYYMTFEAWWHFIVWYDWVLLWCISVLKVCISSILLVHLGSMLLCLRQPQFRYELLLLCQFLHWGSIFFYLNEANISSLFVILGTLWGYIFIRPSCGGAKIVCCASYNWWSFGAYSKLNSFTYVVWQYVDALDTSIALGFVWEKFDLLAFFTTTPQWWYLEMWTEH